MLLGFGGKRCGRWLLMNNPYWRGPRRVCGRGGTWMARVAVGIMRLFPPRAQLLAPGLLPEPHLLTHCMFVSGRCARGWVHPTLGASLVSVSFTHPISHQPPHHESGFTTTQPSQPRTDCSLRLLLCVHTHAGVRRAAVASYGRPAAFTRRWASASRALPNRYPTSRGPRAVSAC